MAPLSYRHHRFPPAVIQPAVWLYLRFTPSYRDVEELLAERGLDLSYETVRRWVLKFGPTIARNLRCQRARPSDRWHLDEMVVRIAGRRMYLWRAVVTPRARKKNRRSSRKYQSCVEACRSMVLRSSSNMLFRSSMSSLNATRL
jgi:transposase-like protein